MLHPSAAPESSASAFVRWIPPLAACNTSKNTKYVVSGSRSRPAPDAFQVATRLEDEPNVSVPTSLPGRLDEFEDWMTIR